MTKNESYNLLFVGQAKQDYIPEHAKGAGFNRRTVAFGGVGEREK